MVTADTVMAQVFKDNNQLLCLYMPVLIKEISQHIMYTHIIINHAKKITVKGLFSTVDFIMKNRLIKQIATLTYIINSMISYVLTS